MKNLKNRNAFLGGAYSLTISAVVLAIVIVINIFVNALPTSMTKYDISSSKLYSITSNTKVVVNALEEDVTIYWIVQADQEDDIIENLLGKYESLSEHIEVVKKNPDVYPTFAEQYTDGTVSNNCLVVECGDRYRFIDYNDIYVYETDTYSYSYTTSFDGEGAITSAIEYVVTEDLPQMYVVEGHGEAELPSSFTTQVEKENIQMNTLSLLSVDEIPQEADCVMIYSPSSDISEEEAKMLSSYVKNGGKLMVVAGPVQDVTLDNLYQVLETYGIEAADGIVVEENREYYSYSGPVELVPDMNSSAITDSLIADNYYPIMPVSTGLLVSEEASSATVTELLVTSDTAFSKIDGYALTTYEKEEGDIDGPFALGVSVEDSSGGQLVWYSSAYFLEDVSSANIELAMNSLANMIGEREAMAIPSKSLSYDYLTISESISSFLKVVMIGIVPLTYLGIGIYVVMRRRRLQNETV